MGCTLNEHARFRVTLAIDADPEATGNYSPSIVFFLVPSKGGCPSNISLDTGAGGMWHHSILERYEIFFK